MWFNENIKTTKLNDSNLIPLVSDNSKWKSSSSPAYCWYENNENEKAEDSALYNWYTINTNKLCPEGWHIPTNNDWRTLIYYIGSNAGEYIKATDS